MSFSSIWPTSEGYLSEAASQRVPPASAGLDLLLLISISGLREVRLRDIGNPEGIKHHESAGQGAVSSVVHGVLISQPVAIKRSRVAYVNQPDHKIFQAYLRSLAAELRVALQFSRQKHPNIVDIIAYGVEGISGPDAFLVYEYTKFGSLDGFLKITAPIPATITAKLCVDVARGLHALHCLKICHGDVKPGNVLVFKDDSPAGWTTKLCDFGQAIAAKRSNPNTPVRCSPGTPAYNAPEIRKGFALSNPDFTIDLAMKTDVYSFGILVWQSVDDGNYPEIAQEESFSHVSPNKEHTGIPTAQINSWLLESAIEMLHQKIHLAATKKIFKNILIATLQEDPADRHEMGRILQAVESPETEISNDNDETFGSQNQLDEWNFKALAVHEKIPLMEDEEPEYDTDGSDDILAEVSDESDDYDVDESEEEDDEEKRAKKREEGTGVDHFINNKLTFETVSLFRYSLFEILDIRLYAGALDETSKILQTHIAAELLNICEEPDTDEGEGRFQQAHAFMALSECYALGFGVRQNMEKMLLNVWEAARAGLERAQIWYPRLRQAFKDLKVPAPSPQWTAFDISSCSSSAFLPMLILENRNIRRQAATNNARKHMDLEDEWVVTDEGCSDGQTLYVETFAEGECDHLLSLHQAVWTGDHGSARTLLDNGYVVNETTREGRTALFYACLAGDLSMVKALLRYGADATLADNQGITPLHLCILFDEQTVGSAVDLLVANGGSLSAKTKGTIRWRLYDLELSHQPLHWAIQTRNLGLVNLFIEAGAAPVGLDEAIKAFFPEIVDILLVNGASSKHYSLFTEMLCPSRPYRHWLLHGDERLSCISQTLDICEKHGYNVGQITRETNTFTVLENPLEGVKAEEGLVLVEECIQRGCNVKNTRGIRGDSLRDAISGKFNSAGYLPLLELLIKYYTPEELNQLSLYQDSYLHQAIDSNSAEAVELLLRHGADPNLRAGWTRETPFQHCVIQNKTGSPEIIRILFSYGVDTRLDSRQFMEVAMLGYHKTPMVLEFLLALDLSTATIKEYVLYVLQTGNQAHGPVQKRDVLYFTGLMLCHPKVGPLINEKDANGLCFIHHVASWGNPNVVSLLLEAGARGDELVQGPGDAFTALHISLYYGRIWWINYYQSPLDEPKRIGRCRRAAFRIAVTLLEDYHAVNSEWFAGITKFHIAAYLRLEDEIDKALAEGCDPYARGKWPTNGDLVTAYQLYHGSLPSPDSPYFWLLSPTDVEWLKSMILQASDITQSVAEASASEVLGLFRDQYGEVKML